MEEEKLFRLSCAIERKKGRMFMAFIGGDMKEMDPEFTMSRQIENSDDMIDVAAAVWAAILYSVQKEGRFDGVVTAFGVSDSHDEEMVGLMRGIIARINATMRDCGVPDAQVQRAH
jgi:hypothetical protein